MNDSLWKRFVKSFTSDKGDMQCRHCPHATITRTPALPGDLADYEVHAPTIGDPSCQGCFWGWKRRLKDEGRICVKCEEPVSSRTAGITITETDADGPWKGQVQSKHIMCRKCTEKLMGRVPPKKHRKWRARRETTSVKGLR